MRKHYIPAPLFMEVPSLSKKRYPDYAIKEFLGRHSEKIFRYMFQNNLEVVISQDLGYGDFKFIALYTEPYVYGERKIIVNPDVIYAIGKLETYKLICPKTKREIEYKAPEGLLISGWKTREIIFGVTVGYFLLGVERLYELEVDFKKLISKQIPPTVLKKHQKKMLEKTSKDYLKATANSYNKSIIVSTEKKKITY